LLLLTYYLLHSKLVCETANLTPNPLEPALVQLEWHTAMRCDQGGICRGWGVGTTCPGHWTSRYGTKWSYYVLMCYGHSISSPSLTVPTNTTLAATLCHPQHSSKCK